MKWLNTSWKYAKALSVTLSTFTLVMSPVAQGAEAAKLATAKVKIDYAKYNWKVDKKGIQDFLAFSGLNKKKNMTVGEFYQKMRPYYPKTHQRHLDMWVMNNRNELMPAIEASTYQDSEGKEQIRLLMTKNGQTVSFSYNSDNKDKYLKVNNTDLSRLDMLFFENAYRKLAYSTDKVVSKDILNNQDRQNPLKAPMKFSYAEFGRMTPKQRANYLVRIRELVQAAENVEKVFGHRSPTAETIDDKYEYFAQWFLGVQADAAPKKKVIKGASAGDVCIVAGYVSIYNAKTSCGGSPDGQADLKRQQKQYHSDDCGRGQIGCNKLLYNNGGATVCVKNPGPEITQATFGKCPAESPLKTIKDKENLINGYFKSKGIDLNAQVDENDKIAVGNMTKEQYEEMQKNIVGYMKDVEGYVNQAMSTCTNIPLSRTVKEREEQKQACDAIALRKFNVGFYDFATPIPPPPPVADCSFTHPGGEGPGCTCPPPKIEGTINDPERGPIPACVDPIVVAIRDEAKDQCNDDQAKKVDAKEGEDPCKKKCEKGLCIGAGWIWGIGLAAAAGGLFWWLTKDKGDKGNPSTPVDVCPTAVVYPPVANCVPVVTPITPPPVVQAPPTTPITPILPTDPVTPVTPPVVPPPVTLVEATDGTSTSTSGGAR
jgi:hypothetical protein